MFSAGTLAPSRKISLVPWMRRPSMRMRRSVTPGAVGSRRNTVIPWRFGASGLVRAARSTVLPRRWAPVQ